ncbi:MAG TPA: hypothetical protein VIU29_11460, partial [Candidatus Deferrimicrobiaceae bacterium]
MDVKRLGLATATALVAASLSIGTAAAGATTETTVTHGITLDISLGSASQTCGFPIELHTVGMDVLILHYDADGTLASQTLQQHYDGYLLNPANG